jgi:hypothetical protein
MKFNKLYILITKSILFMLRMRYWLMQISWKLRDNLITESTRNIWIWVTLEIELQSDYYRDCFFVKDVEIIQILETFQNTNTLNNLY